MSGPAAKRGTKTIEDWLALPGNARIELIDGEFVEKAMPTFEHGRAQGHTAGIISASFDRRPGGPRGPGGWWIATEVDVLLDGRVYRPDIAGCRRERAAHAPRERPVALRADWLCEIVSDSNRATDTVTKLRRYHQAAVPHYWILDQLDSTLTVYRHTPAGYLVALRAGPFEAIELDVSVLLGEDDADDDE
jgi:Uma2 family endonuclease